MIPATLTLVLFAYAILLTVADAPLWAIAAAGGIGVLWQMLVTFSVGFAQPPTVTTEPGNDDGEPGGES
jgi:hypothetical protein